MGCAETPVMRLTDGSNIRPSTTRSLTAPVPRAGLAGASPEPRRSLAVVPLIGDQRYYGEVYSDNYFWGLATIINSRKSHLSFLTQPQLKLS
jgi:hypothetical protein